MFWVVGRLKKEAKPWGSEGQKFLEKKFKNCLFNGASIFGEVGGGDRKFPPRVRKMGSSESDLPQNGEPEAAMASQLSPIFSSKIAAFREALIQGGGIPPPPVF